MTKFRLLTLLSVFLLPIPRLAFSHESGVDVFKSAVMSSRKVSDEPDAVDADDCFTLGELDITFRTGDGGPPKVGVLLTDPRGRRIGFDPLTRHAWQELPEAKGSIDCDGPNDDNACWGIVQVCGPVSGTYQLEVIAQQTSAYSLSISGRSGEFRDDQGIQSARSHASLHNVGISKGSRAIVLISYSRNPKMRVAAQLQTTIQARERTRVP